MRKTAKNCPVCGYHYTPKRYLRLKTPLDFRCPACDARLKVRTRFFFLAVIGQALPMALVISSAFANAWYWLFLPVVVVLSFFIHYGLFQVEAN